MKRERVFSMVLLAVTFALVVIVGVSSQRTSAADNVNDRPSPMVGLASGQTARVNVVFIGNPMIVAPRRCKSQINFLDMGGTSLITETINLKEGKADFADARFEELNPTDDRVQIRAVISVRDPNAELCAALLHPSLEVFDNDTGKTQIYIGGFDPQPDPP